MSLNLKCVLFISFIGLISCGEKTKNELNTNEDEVVDSTSPQSFVKDSVTYYNGHQKKIDVKYGEYFGFVFETDVQELEWVIDVAIDDHLAYIAESYEPELNATNELTNGKQYFTFSALKAGKAKLKFKTKDSKEVKTIQINII